MYAYSIASDEPANGLVRERLPNGELAWLRPQLDAAIHKADQLDRDLGQLLDWRGAEPREPRYWITDEGRRALDEDRRARALEALFGRPLPTVAETSAA
jgi:hypothetical protein